MASPGARVQSGALGTAGLPADRQTVAGKGDESVLALESGGAAVWRGSSRSSKGPKGTFSATLVGPPNAHAGQRVGTGDHAASGAAARKLQGQYRAGP